MSVSPDIVTVDAVAGAIKTLGGLGLLIWILLKQVKLETSIKNFGEVLKLVVAHDRDLVGVKKDIERNAKDINNIGSMCRELKE